MNCLGSVQDLQSQKKRLWQIFLLVIDWKDNCHKKNYSSTGSSKSKSNCRYFSWDQWRLVQQWEWERKKNTNSSQWKRANNSNLQWWRRKWRIKVWMFWRCELRRFSLLPSTEESKAHPKKKKRSHQKSNLRSQKPRNKHQIQKRKQERKFVQSMQWFREMKPLEFPQ